MANFTEAPVKWPPRFSLFGVLVSATTCDEACDAILDAVRERQPAVVSAFSVHALMEVVAERSLASQANRFALIVPDGQPVRWALNWLHGAALERNVRGADLMWRLCTQAEEEDVSIYLYGGTPQTLSALETNLRAAFPTLRIVGAESPPFRPLTAEEDEAMIDRVHASGADLLFLGLGAPKQDHFAAQHAGRIQAVQVCLGAAFDFHAGFKTQAPTWMQRVGLEWVFRLCQEPRRLWQRYLRTNTQFIAKLAAQFARQRMLGFPAPVFEETLTS